LILKAVFFISVFAIVYTYFIYPAVIYLWGTFFRKPAAKNYASLPVSAVLVVRNEEDKIEDRITNLLDQEYPRKLVEIIVVSDGSTDNTLALASRVGNARVKTVDTGRPVGKALAINAGVKAASHDIIIFADARQSFSRNVFAELASMFHDEKIGAVSGELVLTRQGKSEVNEGVDLYWKYEKLIRRKESAADSVIGATGSIYAIRKALFEPLPEQTILDDFLIPMRIALKGYRVVFIRSAKAFDRVTEKAAHEFARKVRTLAGNFQALKFEKALLNPAKNRLFFQLVSHKLTRLAVPYFCIAALVSNCFLIGAFFRFTLIVQLCFYALVLLKFTPLAKSIIGGIIRVAWTFAVLNAAAVMGLFVFLRGRESAIWKKQ
jgi:biofilm PGA synthesis N-glycosyltransferase PgaC